MKIIVGLGNPGLRYKNTRHNIGFKVLDLLAKKHRLSIKKKAFQGVCGVGRIAGQEVMLFKPLTYMNLSGDAVNAVCSLRLENREDLLVISDDIDLPFGHIRFREKGSAGGHNGLQSIIGKMGSEFNRLKVGIRGSEAIPDAAAYVLASFKRAVRGQLNEILDEAVERTETWLEKGPVGVKEKHNKQ